MTVEARKLTSSDLESVYSIAKDTLFPLWQKKDYEFFLTHSSAFCWGIDDSRGLACFVLTLTTGSEVDVVSIATRKEAQNKGMARNLLQRVLELSQASSAFLEVDPTNEPAVKLYLGAGFKVLGVRKKYYEGKKDAWLMKWAR